MMYIHLNTRLFVIDENLVNLSFFPEINELKTRINQDLFECFKRN